MNGSPRGILLVRKAVFLPLMAFLSVCVVGLVWASIINVAHDGTASLMILGTAMLGAGLLYSLWRRSYVVVGSEGVKSGWFGSEWVRWSEVAGFGTERPDPAAMFVCIETRSGEPVRLAHIPFLPLFVDTTARREAAAERLIGRLEAAQQEHPGWS